MFVNSEDTNNFDTDMFVKSGMKSKDPEKNIDQTFVKSEDKVRFNKIRLSRQR